MNRKIFIQLMTINILIGLIQPCNQFIDNILTGRGLGEAALAAFALFLPIGALASAVSSIFSIGAQVSCSHLLGRGKKQESQVVFSTALVTGLVFAVIFAGLISLFSENTAVILGASYDVPDQMAGTVSYLRGYAIGVPMMFLLNIMLPFLQLEGRKDLTIFISITILVINCLGDLANLYIAELGMFGMALATSLANITAFVMVLMYFLRKSSSFRFSFRQCNLEKFQGIISHGLPSFAYYGSIVVRTAVFNYIIIFMLDRSILSVMAVINSYMSLVDAAIGGTGDAVLLLGGVLCGQKDKNGERELLRTAFVASTVLLLAVSIFTVAFRMPIAAAFSDQGNPEFISQCGRALFITALYFLPDVWACILKKYVQALGKSTYTTITNVLCNVVYVCVSAVILIQVAGSDGLFLSLLACYVMMLLTHIIYAWYCAGRSLDKGTDIMLFIPDDFGISESDLMERICRDLGDVMEVSREAGRFGADRGIDYRRTYWLSLFIEEMGKNVIIHGFESGRRHTIRIRLLVQDGKVTCNIQDDCRAFDPGEYLQREQTAGTDGFGIRMIMGMSYDVTYVNTFHLNNLKVEM